LSVDEIEDYESRLLSIKTYIFTAKDAKRKIRISVDVEVSNEKMLRSEVLTFMTEEIERLMSDIEDECPTNFTEIADEDLVKKSKKIDDLNKTLETVSSKYLELVAYCSDKDVDAMKKIKERYKKLLPVTKKYICNIEKEIEKRDLSKEDSFDATCLNIQLDKFKGYASTVDFYSFKRKFEKLFYRSTPRRMLPDLLKKILNG